VDPAHPALAGRARWVLGTSRFRAGDFEGALAAYTAAAADFTRAGEDEHRGAVQHLAAESELLLGHTTRGHALAHDAIMALRAYPASVWRYSALNFLAQLAAGEGLHATSVAVQDEAIATADAHGGPIYAAESRLTRARLRATAGESVRAELDAVRPIVAGLEPAAAREWMTADLRYAAAIEARASEPAASAATLDSVIDFFTRAQVATRLVAALTARADAHLAAGHHAAAEADLGALAALLEDQRAAITRVPLRGSLLADAESVFERMALLHVAAGRADAALAELQRGRRGTSTAQPAADALPPQSPPADPDETVLQLAVLGDSLLAWTAVNGTLTLSITEVARADVIVLVDRTRAALELRADANVLMPALELLHDLLIAPVAPRLSTRGLVIIPHGVLADVPFAALHDADSGEFLIERWPLRFAGSMAEARRPRRARGPAPAVAVIADPAFDPGAHRGLRRLPGAAAEAGAIRALHHAARVIAGPAADSAAVIGALRGATVAHFAGHAVLDDARPEHSYLVLAPATPPDYPAGRRDDGRLTAAQIARLDLAALDLVVLAACRTLEARARRSHGFAGVAEAFRAAGAGGVIGTTWRVSDETTAPLMTELHRAYAAGRSAPDALRDAQILMIRSSDPGLRSPATWGGFRYAGH
jgi:CHAT domain-containing protein